MRVSTSGGTTQLTDGILNATMRALLGAARTTRFLFRDNGMAELLVDDESESVTLVNLRRSPVDPTM